MKTVTRLLLASLAILGLCLLPRIAATRQPVLENPDDAIVWLRSLLTEARTGLSHIDGYEAPGLFEETVADGRSYFQVLEGALASDWVRIDEAVSLLLVESDAMRASAETAVEPQRTRFVNARRIYLVHAASLLETYRDKVTILHANALDGLVEGLSDWVLPGEIQIREIGGGGRLDFSTGAFSGRLSGRLELPGLETTLAIPNLSFDSRGNIDLLAHGGSRIPPNDPGSFLLEIPVRRPLALHLAETGDFSVSGGMRLELADGNTFEGFFDVDDPDYAFGLAFSGSLLLDLARDITLVRPTFVGVNVAEANALLVLGGLGEVFGSLGSGLESFLGNAPDLPAPDNFNIGAPPEFEAPETVVPLNVIDAWIVAMGNEHLRPAINTSGEAYNDALAKIREILGVLREDIAAQERETASRLARIRRLTRLHRLNNRMAALLAQGGAGASDPLLVDASDLLLPEVAAAAAEAVPVARELLESTMADPEATDHSNFKVGFAAARVYLETVATASLLGGDATIPDVGLISAKINEWRGAALDRFGFDGSGAVVDAMRVDALAAEDFYVLALFSLEVESLLLITGGAEALGPLPGLFIRRSFEKVRDAYQVAVAGEDLATRAAMALRLFDFAAKHEMSLLSADAAEVALMFAALSDTFEVIVADRGARGQKTAGDFFEAARRLVEAETGRAHRRKRDLLGQSNEDRDQPFPGNPSPVFEEETLFQKAARLLAGGAAPSEKTRLQNNLAAYLEAYAAGTDERYAGVADVQRNLRDGLDRLVFMADALAFAEAHLPDEAAAQGALQTSWQALHIQWTPLAEAGKLHWMAAQYLRQLNASGERYGDGVSTALRGAFATAGGEAGAGLENIIAGLEGMVGALGAEAFEFALPGNIEIRRFFGEVAFNRQTQLFGGTFGGHLVFPDLGAEFLLSAASLQSDGSYSFAGQSRFPLGGPGLSIESTIDAQGTAAGDLSAEGAATITVGEGDFAGTYAATLAFDSATGDMRFTAATAGVSFGFGEDAVFFPNILQVRLNAGDAPFGEIEVSGSAGFLANGGAGTQPEDFLVFVEDLTGTLIFSEAGFALSLDDGTLLLPEAFAAGSCPGGGGPSIALNSAAPLTVAWVAASGALSLTGEIGFNNLLLALPDFGESGGDPLVSLEICAATLTFAPGVAPVFALTPENPGIFTAQLPNSPLVLNITNFNWPLDGFPTALDIELGTDEFILAEENGVRVALGIGPGGSPPRLRAEENPDGSRVLELSGGARVILPAEILGTTGGEDLAPLVLSAPDAFVRIGHDAAGDPFLVFDPGPLTATGDFVAGGQVELRNLDLRVDGLGTLLGPSPFWQVSLNSGRLVLPEAGGMEFAIAGTSFIASNGAFNIDVIADAGTALDGFRLTGFFAATRTAGGGFGFGGSGDLVFPDETTAIAASVEFADGRLVATASTASGLFLADDFVVLEGGATTSVVFEASATGGSLALTSVSIGMLAYPEVALAADAADFQLVVQSFSGTLFYSEGGFAVEMSTGTLLLPEVFAGGDCPGGGGPFVDLGPAAPLAVAWDAASGALSLTGEIGFNNLFLALPGFGESAGEPLASLEICAATLTFAPGAAPVFAITEANPAVFTAQLPNGPLVLNITSFNWPLDGLPEGTVTLPENTILAQVPDLYALTLLGAGADGCADAALTFGTENGTGAPFFNLSGGLAFAFAADILASADAPGPDPEPVALRGCGSFAWTAGQAPSLTVAELSASGELILGGSAGARLSVDEFTAENPGSLFDPDAPDPFRLIVADAVLLFDNGVFFAVTSGTFATDGSFALAVAAAGGADGFNLSLAASATRSAAGAFDFGGSGLLSLPDDGPTFIVALDYSFDPVTGQSLGFSGGAQNLILADDVVVFEGGFSFAISGMSENNFTGSASIGGESGISVGLFRDSASAGVPDGDLSLEDFILSVTDARLDFAFGESAFGMALSGQLNLPEGVFAPTGACAGQAGSPSVGIPESNPLTLGFSAGDVFFSGAFNFANFCFALPDFADFFVFVESATIAFSGDAVPALSGVNAVLSLPFPDPESEDGDPILLGVVNAAWALDGFPVGTIQLQNDFDLFNQGGFRFTVLAGANDDCELPTAFTIAAIESGPFAGLPEFTLSGGIRFALPAEVLVADSAAGSEIETILCTGVTLRPGEFPKLLETSLAFSAKGVDWRLGGEGGLIIEGASIQAAGLQNLFNLSPATPFSLTLSGGLRIDDLGGFALQNASFVFDGTSLLPAFTIQGVTFSGDPSIDLLPGLPLSITKVGLEFQNENLPVIPTTIGGPWLFNPNNLEVTLSAGLSLAEIITGRVDDLVLSLDESGIPQISLNGFGFGIEDLQIPPLDLAGQVYIGNLSKFDPQDLSTLNQIFFAGVVGGKLNGAGVKALIAFRLDGLIGACLDVSAGPVGIPLGPTGFFLTGAQGGVSFQNRAGDPCDFNDYIQIGTDDRPEDTDLPDENAGAASMASMALAAHQEPLPLLITWEELREVQEQAALEREIYDRLIEAGPILTSASGTELMMLQSLAPMDDGGPEIPCPTGDCPPATVNIFCTPHPDPVFGDRVIIKFSSLDEAFLNGIGLSRSEFALLGIETAAQIATHVANAVDGVMQTLVPEVDPIITTLPDGETLYFFLVDQRETQLQRLRDLLYELVFKGVEVIAAGDNVYDALLDMLYAGVPCPDFTIKLTGTFSHASVSSFLSGTGGVLLSTTGSAGVVGSVNLLGLPVGQLRGFISVTDRQGDPNPSACGVVTMAFGPVELGGMQIGYTCDGCITGMLANFGGLLGCLADTIIEGILARVAPEVLNPLKSPFESALDLDDEQRVAFLAELFVRPDVLAQPGMQTCLINFAAAQSATLQPEILLCGGVQPKLFGFSMGDSIVEVRAQATRNSFGFGYSYSPTAITVQMLAGLGGGIGVALGQMFPPVDQASFGVAMAIPDILDAITAAFEGKLATPEAILQFAEDGFEYMLANALFTTGYRLSPFGLDLFDTQARLLLPNFVRHPADPSVNFQYPEDRGLPTRSQVLLAALNPPPPLTGVLANPTWKGDEIDLPIIFPEGSPERTQITGKTLARDYFPHGGILSASILRVPNVLYEAPPPYVGTLFNPNVDLGDFEDLQTRFGLVQQFLDDYLLATTEAGALAFYFPAPNPPFFDDGAGEPLTPRKLLDAILEMDPGGVGVADPYAVEAVFLEGYLDGRLLGIPFGRAEVSAGTENIGGQELPYLVFNAALDPGTWISELLPPPPGAEPGASARIAFEMRQPPTLPIADQIALAAAEFAALPPAPSDAQMENFLNTLTTRMTEGLPKVSLEVEAGVVLPPALQDFVRLDGGAQLGLYAYSLNYNPNYGIGTPATLFPDPDPTSPGPYTLAVRRGGVVLAGSLRFGWFGDPNPDNHIVIDIPEASLAITAGSSAVSLPGLSGRLIVEKVDIPGFPRFSAAMLNFNSSPDNLAPYLAFAGTFEAFSFGIPLPDGSEVELLSFAPLNAETDMRAEIEVRRDDANGPIGVTATARIDALSAAMPFLGDVGVTVYGSRDGLGGYLPFSFSSAPGEEWDANVCVSAPTDPEVAPTLKIRNPFAPLSAPVAMEFTPNGPICGTFHGVGVDSFEMELIVPLGFTAVFFPDEDTRTEVFIGGTGSAIIALDSNGRLHVDFGPQNDIGLPGVLTASGRLEFGFNPGGDGPNIIVSPQGGGSTVSFPITDLSQTSVRSVTVFNSGNATAQVIVSATPAQRFSTNQGGFTIPPGGSRVVDVIFHPEMTGNLTGNLRFETNAEATPVLNVPLAGTAISQPIFFQSRTNIGFSQTVPGGVSKASITIGNHGSAPTPNIQVAVVGEGFSVSPSSTFSLQPGQSRLLVVEFTPTEEGPYNGTLNLTAPLPIGNKLIPLSGFAAPSPWITLLDAGTTGSNAALRDIQVFRDGYGLAVGDAGAFFETRDFGRSWTPRELSSANLRKIEAQERLTTPILARYHFEEAGNPLSWRDDGPNGYHASARSIGNAPFPGFQHGRFGRGLFFFNPPGFPLDNDSADYVELGNFDVPNSFAIALWISPETTNNGQLFVGKHTATGGNQFLFGFYNSGYHVRIGNQTFTGGTRQSGWQHLVVNALHDAVANNTTVTVYRDGTALWTHTFSGTIGNIGHGLPWVLGQDWDTSSSGPVVSDFFYGRMDEVYFFSGALSPSEISALADGKGGMRIFVAGSDGTLLQSETLGRIWRQNPDQNVNGWRQRLAVFRNYTWNGLTFRPDGRALLAGSQRALFGFSRPTVFIEDHYDPHPFVTGDEEYDEASLDLGHLGTFDSESLNDITSATHSLTTRSYAVSSRGHIFTDSNGLGGTWQRHGGFSANTPLNSIVSFSSFPFATSYLAVGNAGTIVRSNNGADPTLVNHGTTTAHLRAIAWNGISTAILPGLLGPFFHAVGDNGAYVVSRDSGLNWQTGVGGLEGTNYGVSAQETSGTIGYRVWVAGEQQRIQHLHRLPFLGLKQPFLTFYPGALDYGQVILGESRTRPMRLTNRGKAPVSITSISVSGNGFSLAQGQVAALAPGDSLVLQIRYRPTAPSDFDFGEVTLVTTDLGQTFRFPLGGRCVDSQWQPILLAGGGQALVGTVLDLAQMTTGTGSTTLLAVVDSPDRSHIYRSTNNGSTWADITPTAPSGEVYRLRTIEASRTTSGEIVIAAGERRTTAGGFVDGVLLHSQNGGNSWFNRTPADGVNLAYSHADIFRDTSVHNTYSSTSFGSGADVWVTTDTGFAWTNRTQRPATNFTGGKTRIFPILNTTPVQNGLAVTASAGAFLYARDFNGDWPYSAGFPSNGIPVQAFANTQTIRDFLFTRGTGLLTTVDRGWIVGDSGLFWRWEREGSVISPFQANTRWFPASDAEVFGRTNIESVAFVNGHSRGYAAGGARIFTTPNDGRSWDIAFDAGENAQIKTVTAYPLLIRAWAGGSLDDKAVVWRYQAVSNLTRPILSANDFERFDNIAPGTTVARTVPLQNVGNTTLNFHNIRIESDDPLRRFRINTALPLTASANQIRNLLVTFDALPDPVDVATLNPDCFFRFEEPWDATAFSDHGPLKRGGTFPANAAQRPRIDSDEDNGRRGRALRLDGGQYAEIQSAMTNLNNPFAFTLWMNADNPKASGLQAVFGKHATNGADLVYFGIQNGQYVFNIRGTSTTLGPVREGWHHVAINVTPAITQFGTFSNVALHIDGVLAISGFIQNGAGSVGGKPWQLGARWTGSASVANFFSGWLDDFGILPRILNNAEIRMLANASPLAGEHRARLIVNSNAENGERVIELRALVNETSDLIVIDTVPSGAAPVTVNGISHTTPAAFAVRSYGGDERNWVEGSVQTIGAPTQFTVTDAAGNDLAYRFSGWSAGSSTTQRIIARAGTGRVEANYEIASVTPLHGTLATAETDLLPLSGGFKIADRLEGTPAGPFIRLTNGSLNIGGLGSQAFTIQGELFISVSRVRATLATAALNIPNTTVAGGRFLELGASSWLLELNAGESFTLRASPPSLRMMGYDVAADGTFAMDFDFVGSTYAMAFSLNEDFRPIPDFLEFKKGLVSAQVSAPAGQVPSFLFRVNGGLRALKLPNSFPTSPLGSGGWAINSNIAFVVNTGNFSISLAQVLGQSAPMNIVPASFGHPFQLLGDLSVTRTNGGPLVLNAAISDFRVNGTSVASLAGSVSTTTEMVLTGGLPGNTDLRLFSGGKFSLRHAGGGPVNFNLRVRALPAPSFRLEVPPLTLHSNAVGYPANGISLPGVTIDSRGDFDTGKIPLPTFTFDGIAVSRPSGGALAKNYIQLKRDTNNRITFAVRAQLPFLPGCELHDFALTIDSAAAIKGSFRGSFCVLPEPVSLQYNSSAACQFNGSAFGFTIYFGSGCAGVRNDFSGLCILGSCP